MEILYPYPASYTLPKDQKVFDQTISTGKCPVEICIGVIASDAFLGADNERYPYNFSHCGLESIQLKFEDKLIPSNPLTMDYANNNYLQAYRYSMLSAGQLGKQNTFDISFQDFKNGYVMYCFNLRADEQTTTSYFPDDEFGTVRVLLKFKADLTVTHTLFVIKSFKNQVYISRNREFSGNVLAY
jgi:hypothetical protein